MNIFERIESFRAPDARGRFIVIVHDVCPHHSPEIQELLAALQPLVGRNISAAVVPNWHGCGFDIDDSFTQIVTRQFGEILLHGWTHQRETGRGVISYFTKNSDEFTGLGHEEAIRRLQLAQDQLTKVFGHRVSGFIPPAWQRGPIDRKMLRRHDLEFLLGYLAIECVDGTRIPLSTLTWDVGRFARLGIAAEMIGRALRWGRRQSISCLALHPVDVSRGYLPRIVSTVESWLQSGGTPVLPSELLRTASEVSAS